MTLTREQWLAAADAAARWPVGVPGGYYIRPCPALPEGGGADGAAQHPELLAEFG